MMELNIQHYGDGLELYLARISQDQWLRLERACARWFGIYRKATLHRKWYGADRDFRRIFGVHDWRQLYTDDHHYYGPLLTARTEWEAFFERTVIIVDGEEVRVDGRQVRTRFAPALAQSTAGDQHIWVCHGEGYTGYTRYVLDLEEAFDAGRLHFEFQPCGDNGYVLQTLRYGDSVLQGSDDPEQRSILMIETVSVTA